MTKLQSFKVLVGAACVLAAGAVFTIGSFFLFGPPADVHDTKVLSPDGAYTATLHEVNTGAAGSYSQALLRKTAEDKEVILVDGGWGFVNRVKWRSSQTLIVR